MKGAPSIGTLGERQFVVEPRHLIDFGEGQMPAVLCTPALVGFLERTARETLTPWLEAEESSVGTELELKHLAPTPPGQTVACLARIIHVEGRRITFQIEARDQQELIARGVHTRHVICMDRFAQVVGDKTSR